MFLIHGVLGGKEGAVQLHPSSVQTFPSAPCSQTPSVYVPPVMSGTIITVDFLIFSQFLKVNFDLLLQIEFLDQLSNYILL
jgi:hypothetical protein